MAASKKRKKANPKTARRGASPRAKGARKASARKAGAKPRSKQSAKGRGEGGADAVDALRSIAKSFAMRMMR